ncbi:uncharacterized protein AKAME5_001515500 [Lates japonicus]|uniref:Uncharacterized protein n=1 Tax=Lates japonicus TaxID=270547 RepID=A0AAD3N1V9_LATJO|nr:uncharacterized protein AKAME5_001515500 [Lates japonicus]
MWGAVEQEGSGAGLLSSPADAALLSQESSQLRIDLCWQRPVPRFLSASSQTPSQKVPEGEGSEAEKSFPAPEENEEEAAIKKEPEVVEEAKEDTEKGGRTSRTGEKSKERKKEEGKKEGRKREVFAKEKKTAEEDEEATWLEPAKEIRNRFQVLSAQPSQSLGGDPEVHGIDYKGSELAPAKQKSWYSDETNIQFPTVEPHHVSFLALGSSLHMHQAQTLQASSMIDRPAPLCCLQQEAVLNLMECGGKRRNHSRGESKQALSQSWEEEQFVQTVTVTWQDTETGQAGSNRHQTVSQLWQELAADEQAAEDKGGRVV